MKPIKLYISLFLWLACGILLLSTFITDSEVEQLAMQNTNKVLLENTQVIGKEKLKKISSSIAQKGNDERDLKTYQYIENSYFFINQFYNNEITFDKVLNILSDSSKKFFREKQKLQFVTTENEVVKQIFKTNLYQNTYYCLEYEYDKVAGGCGDFNPYLRLESDSTYGFCSPELPLEMELPKTTIQFINQKNNKESSWYIETNKNSNKPIIFQINTYTETDTIRKRYQIKPQKGKKLKPFDYEEID